MSTFKSAVENQSARTLNDMKAFKDTSSACVDLFFKAGAMRGQNIIPVFTEAYSEDPELALRISLWLRDVRQGAGERQLFKDILNYVAKLNKNHAEFLIDKISELGRWDDGFSIEDDELFFYFVNNHVAPALNSGNSLCAKWCPRKGKVAEKLRKIFGLSPKNYRKLIVNLSNTVETSMCAKQWDSIDFSKVPSLAHARYRKAFYRNAPEFYGKYVEDLTSGNTKINAAAVYPYDVVKNIRMADYNEIKVIEEQWDALPNYMGERKILPMIDVSGSMYENISKNLSALDVAVSLGMYSAMKNTGKFHNMFLTFSSKPDLILLKSDSVYRNFKQLLNSPWGMTTDLHEAFSKVLQVAIEGCVPQEEMPDYIVIFSDMQFDQCIRFDDSAYEMIQRKYNEHGYEIPNIIFWNILSYDNVPVKYHQKGVALVSGFSPSIMKAVLSANFDNFTPYNIMINTVMVDRYNLY